MRRNGGYTLVELVVAIAIFGIVMMLISVSFSRIVASSGQVMKSVETDIGGLIGLELFRVDVGFAGFGLPWSLGAASYVEAVEQHKVNGIRETDATSFNDSPSNPPRPFVVLDDKGFNKSDYLVLKGSALGLKSAARSWSYLSYSSVGAILKPSKSEVELIPGSKDRVIVINNRPRGGVPVRELVTDGSSFILNFDRSDNIPKAFRPRNREDRLILYGIAPAPEESEDVVTFPFNRVDYYVGPSTTLSATCAPGTGALFRGMVSQKGNFKPMSILDCVADLQVVLLVDNKTPDGTPVVTSYDDFLNCVNYPTPAPDLAEAIRRHVKEIRIYILAQQGKRDSNYSYPFTNSARAIEVGKPEDGGRAWSADDLAATFGRDWKRYHWKVYTIAVQPQNFE